MNSITTGEILTRVRRRYGINFSNNKSDAVLAIRDAISGIGYHMGFTHKVYSDLEVSDYKCRLPDECVRNPKAIWYQGYQLPYSSDQRIFKYAELGGEQTTILEGSDIVTPQMQDLELEVTRYETLIAELEADPTNQDLIDAANESKKKVSSMTRALKLNTISDLPSLTDSYNIDGRYVKTSFSTGLIDILCKIYPVDEVSRLPLIVDSYSYVQAVMWYIFKELLLMGYTHPEFNYEKAEKKWIEFKGIAHDEGILLSIPEREEFTNFWTRMSINDQILDKIYTEV